MARQWWLASSLNGRWYLLGHYCGRACISLISVTQTLTSISRIPHCSALHDQRRYHIIVTRCWLFTDFTIHLIIPGTQMEILEFFLDSEWCSSRHILERRTIVWIHVVAIIWATAGLKKCSTVYLDDVLVEDCLIGFLEPEAVLLVAQNWQVSKLLVLLVEKHIVKKTNVFIMTF